MEGRQRKGGESIEEGKGRKGRGRNIAFHHLLLSNLTAALFVLVSGYVC